MLLGLHKASFLVWFGAMSVHVLAYARRAAPRATRSRTSSEGTSAAAPSV
jgi:hypothetical protein